MHELESILNKNGDLDAEKTLQNPYLIEKINSQKIYSQQHLKVTLREVKKLHFGHI